MIITANCCLAQVEKASKSTAEKCSLGTLSSLKFWIKIKESSKKFKKRKNRLDRPPVANIDKLVILISCTPKPDFALIDKMLVYSAMNKIQAHILVNKADLGAEEIFEAALFDYGKQADSVTLISTLTKFNLDKVENEVLGGLVCLVGQSAVGKSSLINALNPKARFETGEMSKINRGRHTTRHSEIFKLDEGSYIIDTPGFSFLEIDLDPKELNEYYFDFKEGRKLCKFRSCVHINEPECKILEMVENGEISKARYERYLNLYNELQNKWRRKYD